MFRNKKEHDIKTGGINKLVQNLMPKYDYVFHYRNLQYYLSQELILKKVQKILEFKQSAWMKPYIDFNTQKKKKKKKKQLMKLIKIFLNY